MDNPWHGSRTADSCAASHQHDRQQSSVTSRGRPFLQQDHQLLFVAVLLPPGGRSHVGTRYTVIRQQGGHRGFEHAVQERHTLIVAAPLRYRPGGCNANTAGSKQCRYSREAQCIPLLRWLASVALGSHSIIITLTSSTRLTQTDRAFVRCWPARCRMIRIVQQDRWLLNWRTVYACPAPRHLSLAARLMQLTMNLQMHLLTDTEFM